MPKGTRLQIGTRTGAGEWGAERMSGDRWSVWNNAQQIREVATTKSLMTLLDDAFYVEKDGALISSSFKSAVPGNLADNTKPSTPATQKQAVELLKQGGILPETEKAVDYPVLTADAKRRVIETLLRRRQPKLAMWSSRNLVSALEPGTYHEVIGDRLREILTSKRVEMDELRDDIEEIEKAWKNWDYKTMVRMGLIDQRLAKQAQQEAESSFKAAVPGNLADNTKPSTPATQKQAVDLLKQGGILPETEKAVDYPVLTAELKREIVEMLLRGKEQRLATWASRNLVVSAKQTLDENLAMTSHDKDQDNHIFKFTEMQGPRAAMFTVMISPSGLLSTKNTKGTPTSQAIHKATNFARKQLR